MDNKQASNPTINHTARDQQKLETVSSFTQRSWHKSKEKLVTAWEMSNTWNALNKTSVEASDSNWNTKSGLSQHFKTSAKDYCGYISNDLQLNYPRGCSLSRGQLYIYQYCLIVASEESPLSPAPLKKNQPPLAPSSSSNPISTQLGHS